MALNLKEIQASLENVDFNDVTKWPLPLKIIAIIALAGAVLLAGIWFDTTSQIAALDEAVSKEEGLKNTFRQKQGMAANLGAYINQMDEMKRSFGAMLRQLPSKTEVDAVLSDISQTGLANGLEIELFKPQNEIPAEFYAELPIKIKVTGDYHEFGAFVSDVAALPRIVTLHDVTIKADKDNKKGSLTMETTAKTYRYLEEEEIKEATE